MEHRLAEDTLNLCTELLGVAFVVVRTFRQIEPAYACVVGGVITRAELDAQRLVFRERVLDTNGDVGRLGWTAHVLTETVAMLVNRNDGVGLEVPTSIEPEADRRLAGDDRPARPEIEVAVLLG